MKKIFKKKSKTLLKKLFVILIAFGLLLQNFVPLMTVFAEGEIEITEVTLTIDDLSEHFVTSNTEGMVNNLVTPAVHVSGENGYTVNTNNTGLHYYNSNTDSFYGIGDGTGSMSLEKDYYYHILVDAKEGYVLANNFTARVNGQEAIVRDGYIYFRAPVVTASNHSMALNAQGNDFGTKIVGYGSVDPFTYTINNNGDAVLENINVQISSNDFELGTYDSSVNAGESTSFTIRPKTGLAKGDYDATITISADNVGNINKNVTFKVRELLPSVELFIDDLSSNFVTSKTEGEVSALVANAVHTPEASVYHADMNNTRLFYLNNDTGVFYGIGDGTSNMSTERDYYYSIVLNYSGLYTINEDTMVTVNGQPATVTDGYIRVEAPNVVESGNNNVNDNIVVNINDLIDEAISKIHANDIFEVSRDANGKINLVLKKDNITINDLKGKNIRGALLDVLNTEGVESIKVNINGETITLTKASIQTTEGASALIQNYIDNQEEFYNTPFDIVTTLEDGYVSENGNKEESVDSVALKVINISDLLDEALSKIPANDVFEIVRDANDTLNLRIKKANITLDDLKNKGLRGALLDVLNTNGIESITIRINNEEIVIYEDAIQTTEGAAALIQSYIDNQEEFYDATFDVITTLEDGYISENGNSEETYNSEIEEPSKITVTFETNGGSAVEAQEVYVNGTVEEPSTKPTKDGYMFEGWYKNVALTEEFDFDTQITVNTTIYAKYNKVVDINKLIDDTLAKIPANDVFEITRDNEGNITLSLLKEEITTDDLVGKNIRGALLEALDTEGLESITFKLSDTESITITKDAIKTTEGATALIQSYIDNQEELYNTTFSVISKLEDGYVSENGNNEETYESEVEAPLDASVNYTAHVQSKGWVPTVADGETGGTTGQGLRIEAIKLNIEDSHYDGSILYKTHVQGKGWETTWSKDGEVSGTTGQGKRLEAIQIKLTGDLAEHYDVYYRTHVQGKGWLGWAKNGEKAGTRGLSLRMEAIEVVLVKKGEAAPGSSSNKYVESPYVNYVVHMQKKGWGSTKYDGQVSGTIGLGRRLEAIKISLKTDEYSGNIEYRTHVQGKGWETTWAKNGEASGTTGQGKRLEAIQIKLTGEIAEHYDIYYKVHVQSKGWLGWVKNGETAGTTGQSLRMEAIEIILVKK